jgi:hypothetical protein
MATPASMDTLSGHDLAAVLEHDMWNHVNYAVPPENMAALEECIATLMPWQLWAKTESMLGYRFHTNYEWGMAFFQPSVHAATFARVVDEVRRERPELDEAIKGLESLTPDVNDHTGFIVKSVEEWESRLAAFREAGEHHPEWQITVTGVLRPDDPEALTDRLAQAWIRIGLLGPVRNTFEMQYLNPGSRSAEEIEAAGGVSATPREELIPT